MENSSDVVVQGLARVLIPVGLFLWGMHKCESLTAEENTNPSGALGLMFSLGAWVLVLLYSAFAPMLGWQLSLVVYAGVVVLCGIGAVKSIKGLSSWSRYANGNVHAVLGLLVGVGLAALVLFGLTRAFLST